MKKLLFLFAFFICYAASAQYNPSLFTTSNKAYGVAQAVPTDARTYFYDAPNFKMRAYQNTSEVLTYLSLPKYRTGQFPIIVNTGGILDGLGNIIGGTNDIYYFKNGVADSNLVLLIPGTLGTCAACLIANNNLSDLTNVATARSNLGLGAMALLGSTAAGDLSGTWPTISVVKFNGQPPSYYLNYNNLFNQPTIPAQVNIIAGSGISVTGAYPNVTIANTGIGFTTAGVDLIALSSTVIGLDTANYRKVDSIWAPNDSTIIQKLNGVQYTLSVRGGSHGSGTGTGTVTLFSFNNANGVSGVVTNPSSIPQLTITLGAITPSTVNGLTFTTVANGFTIAGGTGTPHTLTVTANANVAGTNTGDVTLAGTPTYITIAGQVITRNLINLGTDVTGTLLAAQFPALTGQVTTSAGSLVTTIATNTVTNANLAQMPANTIKGNNTVGTANALDLTQTQFTAMVNLFTTSLSGAVPSPGSVTGKVLSDAGTWVANGAGATNTNVGTGYRLAIPGGNTIKTLIAGYGTLMDSTSTANTITVKVDTSIIAVKGLDSIYLLNHGASGLGLGWANGGDTVHLKKIVAGANITFTQNNDSSIIITATGATGGIVNVGTINSQTPSANGLTISGTTIYAQYATQTSPGEVSTTNQTWGGLKSFATAPAIVTLTSLGGVYFGDAAGIIHQTGAGTSTQVLIGGASPGWGAVNLATMTTGILGTGGGGTGTATPSLVAGSGVTVSGTWPNQTISATGGTVTGVTINTGTTGLVATVTGTSIINVDMSASVVNVGAGGTGQSSLATYGVLVGGSTPTGQVQQVPGNGGTAGFLLTSNGPSAVPTWQSPSVVGAHGIDDVLAIGQTLTQARSINASTFSLTVTGSQSIVSNGVLTVTNTGTLSSNTAIKANASGNGIGVYSTAVNGIAVEGTGSGAGSIAIQGGNLSTGVGVQASSQGGIGLQATTTSGSAYAAQFQISPASTNSADAGIQILRTTTGGPVGAGVGVYVDFNVQDTVSQAPVATRLRSSWSSVATQATRVSQFVITGGVGTGLSDLFTLKGTGQLQLNRYGIGTFTGTPAFTLQVDASGNIIEGSGGGAQTLQQVITTGSTLTTPNTISYSTNTLTFSGSGATAVVFSNGINTKGFIQNTVSKNVNYTAVAGTDDVIEVDASGGSKTISLPSQTAGTGATFTVKKTDNSANPVSVNVVGGGNIDGASTFLLNVQNQSSTFVTSAVTTGAYSITDGNNLQQTLGAGSTLTQNNTVSMGTFGFTFSGGSGSTTLNVTGGTNGLSVSASSTAITGLSPNIPLWSANQSTANNTAVLGLLMQRIGATAPTSGEGLTMQFDQRNSSLSTFTSGKITNKVTTTTAGSETAEFDIDIFSAGATLANFVTIAPTGLQVNNATASAIQATSVTNASPAGSFRNQSAVTSGQVTVLNLVNLSTGTPANGFGTQLDFQAQASTSITRTLNSIITQWTNATDASRNSQIAITGVTAATTATWVTINGTDGMKLGAVRFEMSKGAIVSSSGDLTLGNDGNIFHISGTTTINAIITANWQAGSEITLIFDGSLTVKNNTAGGAGTAKMLLAGGVDFSATSNDVLKLVWDGTSFFEESRSVN